MHRFVITRATTSTLTPTPMTRSSSTIWEGGRDGGIAGSKGTDGAAMIGLEGDGGSSGGCGGSGGSDGRFEGVEGGEGGEGGEKGGEGGVGGEGDEGGEKGGEGGEKGGAGCCGNAGGNAGGTAALVSACEPAASMADNARTPMLFVGCGCCGKSGTKSQLWSVRPPLQRRQQASCAISAGLVIGPCTLHYVRINFGNQNTRNIRKR